MALIAVITTLPNREMARSLAAELVERRLVACAQLSEIESIYRWQGELQHEPEIRLLLKTSDALYSAVEQLIVERHSYETPAICSLPLDRLHAPFADWIETELAV